jgi:DNA replication and repair protein RecF
MRLAWVELRDLRNHRHTVLEDLPDGLLVFVGPNGEGKTNLLEGIFVLYAVGTPRAATAEPLVRRGCERAYARGEVASAQGRALIEVEIPRRGAARMRVNRSPVRRRRDLRRHVRAVLASPADLGIVVGDPARRRGFLDEAVVALQPAADTLSSAYDRVLRQRNRLLKEHEGGGAPVGLEAWNEQLVVAGTALTRARAAAVAEVGPAASEAFERITGSALQVRYASNVPTDGDLEEGFRARLAERRDDEIARRTTLVGPHRDDLDLGVRELRARGFASHGESWGAALCLRLGLAAAIERAIGEAPLVLVDDPYSGLDPERRVRLGEDLRDRADRAQVVVTVADEGHVGEASAVWEIRAGEARRRGAA